MRLLALAVVVALTLVQDGAPKAPAPGNVVGARTDFDAFAVGKLPRGFTAAVTGGGGPSAWEVRKDPKAASGANVLVQTSADETDARFPLAIVDELEAKDVDVTVKLRALEGKVDRAGGLCVRLKDKDNYYVVRANALEDNVRFYKIEAGKRRQLAGEAKKVTPGEWHVLRLVASGDRFQVWYDGEKLFEHQDATFAGPGKVALWTKADSVTAFDDLAIEVK